MSATARLVHSKVKKRLRRYESLMRPWTDQWRPGPKKGFSWGGGRGGGGGGGGGGVVRSMCGMACLCVQHLQT